MPTHKKKFSRRPKGSGMRTQGGRVERVVDRLLFSYPYDTIAGGPYNVAFNLQLNPNMTFTSTGGGGSVFGLGKLYSMSGLFQYFRFRRIRFRLLPIAQGDELILAASYSLCGGFVAGTSATLPITLNSVLQVPWCTETIQIAVQGGTIPSVPKWYEVPSSMLLNQNLKWWKNAAGAYPITGDTLNSYVQGYLCFCAYVPASEAGKRIGWTVDVEVETEFKDFFPPTSTFSSEMGLISQLVWRPFTDRAAVSGVASDAETKDPEELEEETKSIWEHVPAGLHNASLSDVILAINKATPKPVLARLSQQNKAAIQPASIRIPI